jgi:hypothetical protein
MLCTHHQLNGKGTVLLQDFAIFLTKSVYQAFLSLFTRPPRRQKLAETTNQLAEVQSTTSAQKADLFEDEEDEDTEDANLPETDPDKQKYDDHVVQKHVQKALDLMALEKVIPTSNELQNGLSLMPKV